MPTIEGLDPLLQTVATAVFVVAVAIFSAFSYVKGKKPVQTETTKEFAVAGQLADMGPVKELVESAGLLFQQQVRTNIHLEATANAVKEVADLLAAHLADLRAEQVERERDEAMEERAKELAGQMVKAMTPPRRRTPAKRRSASRET